MRWNSERVLKFLEANSRVFAEDCRSPRPRFRNLVHIHWRRGGWRDHLLVTVLGPLTLGLAAWLWMRFYGSCCFAGTLDPATGRVGCLIHPLRVGAPDLRRHAFPLIPILGCNRQLRCPMLDSSSPDLSQGIIPTSKAGFRSLRKVVSFRKNPKKRLA
ncbi:MAG: hypothetical protein WCO42_00485 [bacterium]